jgi:flavodoxin
LRSLIVLFSYHHKNTEKIAKAMANVLNAEIKKPSEIDPASLKDYDLVGWGSGVYSAQHHPSLIDLAEKLPGSLGKRAFLFSTTGAPKIAYNDEFVKKNHQKLRDKLEVKGYEIVGEFSCRGWNTNHVLKYFGGLNSGHPDEEDLKKVEEFAKMLKQGLI